MPIRPLLALLLIASVCRANLETAVSELAQDKSNREDSIASLQNTSQEITNEIVTLQDRQAQVYGQIQNLKESGQVVKLDVLTFHDVMKKTMGRCDIQQGRLENEYRIAHKNEQIRIVFPDEILVEKGTMRLRPFNLGRSEVIQVEVEALVEEVSPAETFKAVLRLNPADLRVIQATFIGQRINDGIAGMYSSYNRFQITCDL